MSGKELIDRSAKNVYLEKLDREIWRLYPRIEDTDSDVYTRFKNGRIAFASFNINNSDPDFRKKILATTLRRATDPYDEAFCEHGSERHDDFCEAIQILLLANREDELYIRSDKSYSYSKKNSPEVNYVISSPWMKENGRVFRGRAALKSLQTVAHSYSSPNLHWRPKSRFILENYYNFSTTMVLSAYLEDKN